MFERLTDAANGVISIAQEQAKELGDNYVGSEHLALAMIIAEEDGLTPWLLTGLGVDKQKFREALVAMTGSREEVQDSKPTGQLPFTPRAKRILELSLREAMSLGHNHIGVEHILLAFIRENEGVGPRVLEGLLDVELLVVRQRIMENFQHGVSPRTDPIQEMEWYLKRAKEQVPLMKEQFGEDLVLSPEPERIEKELEKIEKRLARLKKLKARLDDSRDAQ